jgi:release factor glutamine methyltransferase
MTIQQWLRTASGQLLDAGISTARLDCLVLLEDAFARDRAWLFSHPDEELQGSILENLNTKIVQRATHIPLAYLRGHAEFYGRDFVVNEHTLVPRPETETMIELLRGLAHDGSLPTNAPILDVGTGSGCIAITAALELPDMLLSGCDIDEQCLKTAAQNAQKTGASVALFASDLLEHATENYTVLLANLPYVPDEFHINTAATHEPKHAIFGGSDGLDLFRRMFAQIGTRKAATRPRFILTESLPSSHAELAQIAKAASYALRHTDDFIQLFVLG